MDEGSAAVGGESIEAVESNSDEEMVDNDVSAAPLAKQSSNRMNNSLATSYRKAAATASMRGGNALSPNAPSTPPVISQIDPPPTPASAILSSSLFNYLTGTRRSFDDC